MSQNRKPTDDAHAVNEALRDTVRQAREATKDLRVVLKESTQLKRDFANIAAAELQALLDAMMPGIREQIDNSVIVLGKAVGETIRDDARRISTRLEHMSRLADQKIAELDQMSGLLHEAMKAASRPPFNLPMTVKRDPRPEGAE